MEIIHLTHPIDHRLKTSGEKVMALGYFDGVHIGHQKVIQTAVESAREKGQKAAVMTFHPHPSVVLKQLKKRDDYLTPVEEKARLIADLGVDELYIVTFSQAFSQLTPQEFVDTYLIMLDVKHVVAGFDFTYGRMAKGNMTTLLEESRNMFKVTVVPKVELTEVKVSTTLIRDHILEGQVDRVIPMLGRPYSIKGKVIEGDPKGRTIGFPIANVNTDEPYVYPQSGVYAVEVETKIGRRQGVSTVSERTAFNEQEIKPLIEIYLFDFNGDSYGETVTVFWYKKLRDERAITETEELKAQLEKDKREAIAFFNTQLTV
ncbi:riboflavin biosynthesis protein RibF [Pullulanibacillus sp. KACC 23026]|uniref:riboflavin biosynthesis protein RibF n=1 Tax=Pullulanibacillus sp. KACC 23026 TaxID=3028315 RepID=UPI0023AF1040|nr:riboflavin biosynthesis protein RibF [Pullulanibacillus sp. KACC 23026]WEG11577.1 riboflavin biosynthesis protein RibF [Pullulanibacillus sp. KACC 23026]